jgi:hypothetical protein
MQNVGRSWIQELELIGKRFRRRSVTSTSVGR